jgi:hypothetical protein
MHSQAEMMDYFKQCMLSPVEQVNQWVDLKEYCQFKSIGWMAGGDEGAQHSVEFMRELSTNAFAAGALLGAFATMLRSSCLVAMKLPQRYAAECGLD